MMMEEQLEFAVPDMGGGTEEWEEEERQWKVVRRLKRAELSLHNRLRSISMDAELVSAWLRREGLSASGVFGNRSCGSWFVDPAISGRTSYFKSTDGHYGKWGFSLSRHNLHVLEECVRKGVAVVVDSTRKGKRFPDSLSKTVPIWCWVLDAVRFGIDGDAEALLRQGMQLFPAWVPLSEVSEILKSVPRFVEQLAKSPALSAKVNEIHRASGKRLRCIWVDHKSMVSAESIASAAEENLVIVCKCASRREIEVGESERRGWHYIQGASDDQMFWNKVEIETPGPQKHTFRVDADIFWKVNTACQHKLFAASDEQIDRLLVSAFLPNVQSIQQRHGIRCYSKVDVPDWFALKGIEADKLHICVSKGSEELIDLESGIHQQFSCIICSYKSKINLTETSAGNILQVHIADDKKLRFSLEQNLLKCIEFVVDAKFDHDGVKRILIQGEEISVAVCIVTGLLLHFSSNVITKSLVRDVVIHVTAVLGEVFPSRLLMLQLNRFFIR